MIHIYILIQCYYSFYRGRGQTKPGVPATTTSGTSASSSNFSTCRFCLRQSSPEHPVMDSLCSGKLRIIK